MIPSKEELSFVPFQLHRPLQAPKYKREKTLSAQIHESLELPKFLNLLYSLNEVEFLRTKHPNFKPTNDNVSKLIADYGKDNSDKQSILEQLNAMVLSETPFSDTLKIFKASKLPQTLFGWFQKSSNDAINKSMILNLIAFCFDSLEIPKENMGQTWCAIVESLAQSQGSSAKKHLLVLLKIVDFVCDFGKIDEPLLYYSFPQINTISSSFENPLNFQFLLLGETPKSYAVGETIINKLQTDKARNDYAATRQFSSETANKECRAFLISCASSLPIFVKNITQLCQSSSRILYPKVNFTSLFPVGNQPHSNLALLSDSFRERDIILYSAWANAFVTHILLNKSNFFDGEILRHLFLSCTPTSLVSLCFQSFVSDLKSIEKPEPIPCLFATKLAEGENLLPVLDIAIGISLHYIANLIGYSQEKVGKFVTDKVIKNIFNFSDSSGSQIVKREAAYALSRYLRWLSPLNSDISKASSKNKIFKPKLITFIFLNLEEYELYEKLSNELKTDFVPSFNEQDHLADVKKHCEALGVKPF